MSSPSTGSPPIQAAYDLHCHILPTWDDGAKTLEDSLQMAERAVAAGVRYIAATPHVGRAFRGVEHPADQIPGGVERLQKELSERGLDLQIVPACEILLGSVNLLEEGQMRREWTYGGKGAHMLVESPFPTWPDFGNSLVYEIALRGPTPIIAHPERYVDVQRDIEALRSAISQGALVQITADSLLGHSGKMAQTCCFRLLDAGWVHIVASDAHSARSALPGEAIAVVCDRVGEERARQIFEHNPLAVVEGRKLPPQADPIPRRRSLLQRVFG